LRKLRKGAQARWLRIWIYRAIQAATAPEVLPVHHGMPRASPQAMATSLLVLVDAQAGATIVLPPASTPVPPAWGRPLSQLPASAQPESTIEAAVPSLRLPKPPRNPGDFGVPSALVPESGVMLAGAKRSWDAHLCDEELDLDADAANAVVRKWSEYAQPLLRSLETWARQG
jgi:hypothetical protein